MSMAGLQVVACLDSGLREFYLTHGGLAQYPTRNEDTQSLFVDDLRCLGCECV